MIIEGKLHGRYHLFDLPFQMVLQLLIVSTNAVLVLDQRTLGIKYRIPVTEIEAMSLSPYFDRVLILHLRKVRYRNELQSGVMNTLHYSSTL